MITSFVNKHSDAAKGLGWIEFISVYHAIYLQIDAWSHIRMRAVDSYITRVNFKLWCNPYIASSLAP